VGRITPSLIPPITPNEFELLRSLIEVECGIVVEKGKEYLIESRLSGLAVENACRSFGDFYLKAKNDTNGRLRDQIVDAMTTNETMWFRDRGPFDILEQVLLPPLIEEIKASRKYKARIWSAAASTGQEPYSIAMIINEVCRFRGGGVITPDFFQIIATDISPTALETAAAGRYDTLSMSRGMRPEFLQFYFRQEGTKWTIIPQIRKMVTFQKFNLLGPFTGLGTFDIIFCRNVAIYFSDTYKRELFRKLARSLNVGGHLMLGSAESLAHYSTDFLLRDYKNSLFYQVK